MPVALLDVSVTEPPVQNVVGPPAEIVGVDGIGFTVTDVAAEGELVQPDAALHAPTCPCALQQLFARQAVHGFVELRNQRDDTRIWPRPVSLHVH